MPLDVDLNALADAVAALRDRFVRGSSEVFLPTEDQAAFTRLSVQAKTMLAEATGKESEFVRAANDIISAGIGGFFGGPSQACVQELTELLRGAATHVKRRSTEAATNKIPPSVIGVTAQIIDKHYTHAQMDALFSQHRFPGDPPVGNKIAKAQAWMRRANNECPDALDRFGDLIAEMMDSEYPESDPFPDVRPDPRPAVNKALAREGLSYHRGGNILGGSLSGPARSLGKRLADGGLGALQREFDRAYQTVDRDPEAAVTAACAILESLCQTYLEANSITPPKSLTLGPLWTATAGHLGLNPGKLADDDLKRILSGLFSLADGVAALRSHQGSAHGRSSISRDSLQPRYARLAVHAAHTMAMFVLETWDQHRAQP